MVSSENHSSLSLASFVDLPAFGFGDTAELRDRNLSLIVAGLKIAAYAPLRDLGGEGEPMPAVGSRFVLLDGLLKPGAIIEDNEVWETQAGLLTDDFARECGALDVKEWRREQVEYVNKYGGWSDDLAVICERFTVIADLRSGPHPQK